MSLATEQSPVSAPAVAPALGDASRTVTVSVRGLPVSVPEPDWCIAPHDEVYAALEDVSHRGPEVSVSVPEFGGGLAEVLCVAVHQWPFAHDGDRGQPHLAVDADGSGDISPLWRTAGMAFADQLVAHAERIRTMCDLAGGA